MKLDIKFLKKWKREGLIPTFGNVRLSIKQQNPKLKRHISRTALENELQAKHCEESNLKKDKKAINYRLRQLLPTLLFKTVLHQIHLAIHSKVKFIVKRQKRKLIKFRRQYYTQLGTSHVKVNKHIIHNFSSYLLSLEEITALWFEICQHIPHNIDKNSIKTEFENFTKISFKIIPIYLNIHYHESRQSFVILVKSIAT